MYNRIQKTAAKHGDGEVVVYIEQIEGLRHAANHPAGEGVAVERERGGLRRPHQLPGQIHLEGGHEIAVKKVARQPSHHETANAPGHRLAVGDLGGVLAQFPAHKRRKRVAPTQEKRPHDADVFGENHEKKEQSELVENDPVVLVALRGTHKYPELVNKPVVQTRISQSEKVLEKKTQGRYNKRYDEVGGLEAQHVE